MTEPLFDLGPRLRQPTPRQEQILRIIQTAGPDGITADELGAHIHQTQNRHPAGDRCGFCATDGLRVLRERGIADHVTKRGRGSWIARGVPVDRGSQLDRLPGESFEDIFGNAA